MTRIAILAALAACALTTASCGFAPIYAQPGADFSALRNITVESRGQDRVDFLFEQAMADKLGAYKPSGEYRLETVLRERRLGFGIRVDDVATRYESTVIASYRLVRASDGKVMLRGRRDGVASYDVSADPYSELAAEQRSIERAVDLAAEKVRLDLTLYFANLPDEEETAQES